MDDIQERQERLVSFFQQRTKDVTVVPMADKLVLRTQIKRAGVVASLIDYLKSSAYREQLRFRVEHTEQGDEIALEIDLHQPFHIPSLARSLMGVLQLSYTLA